MLSRRSFYPSAIYVFGYVSVLFALALLIGSVLQYLLWSSRSVNVTACGSRPRTQRNKEPHEADVLFQRPSQKNEQTRPPRQRSSAPREPACRDCRQTNKPTCRTDSLQEASGCSSPESSDLAA